MRSRAAREELKRKLTGLEKKYGLEEEIKRALAHEDVAKVLKEYARRRNRE